MNINNETPLVRFFDCFFFSIQTGQTIGYGFMSPVTLYSNAVVSVEAYLSLLMHAAITGFAFAKISRPSRMKRQIRFSAHAVVNKRTPHYMGSANDLDRGQYATYAFVFVLCAHSQWRVRRDQHSRGEHTQSAAVRS
jgi:hypothetical protein